MSTRTPKRAKENPNDEWLSLRQASQLIGVHPATLRAWADRGRLASQRTAGGHRRFRRSEIERWAQAQHEPSSGIEMLIHSALGRARLTLEQADAPWLERLNEPSRAGHRELGRRLLMALGSSLDGSVSQTTSEKQARQLGGEYAALSHQDNLTLPDTVQAFLFFQNALVDSLLQLASHLESPASPDWAIVTRRLNEFTNLVLLSLIEAYQKLDTDR
jgi:excisionase family DNA binding protein